MLACRSPIRILGFRTLYVEVYQHIDDFVAPLNICFRTLYVEVYRYIL